MTCLILNACGQPMIDFHCQAGNKKVMSPAKRLKSHCVNASTKYDRFKTISGGSGIFTDDIYCLRIYKTVMSFWACCGISTAYSVVTRRQVCPANIQTILITQPLHPRIRKSVNNPPHPMRVRSLHRQTDVDHMSAKVESN